MQVRWIFLEPIFDESYKRYTCMYCHKVICTSKKGHMADPVVNEKILSHNQNCYAYQKAILRNSDLKYINSYTISRYEVKR